MGDAYEKIVQNFKNPKNMGSLKDADIVCKDVNSNCGDELEFYIKLDGERIKDIRFSGIACAMSTSTASMLSESVKGRSLGEVEKMDRDDISKLLGIRLSPDKLKCAMLPLSAIKRGINSYKDHERN